MIERPHPTLQEPNDWPQFRGAERDGVARGLALPNPPPASLSRLWRVQIGTGHAGPIVVGDRVFSFARVDERETVRAHDLSTGEPIWEVSYAAPYIPNRGASVYGLGPRATPTFAEGRLVTFGISGVLSAFDAEDGSARWQHDFTSIYEEPAPMYGVSMSPIVLDGLVIAHIGGLDDGSLTAFDLRSGQYRWGLDQFPPGYASPVVLDLDEGRQIVTQTQRHVVGIDPRSGRVLWTLPFTVDFNQTIVTPLAVGRRLIVSGLHRGVFAIEPVLEEGRWRPVERWHTSEVSMYMSSPVLAAGRVFGFSHRRSGQYFALDPSDGSVEWTSTGRDGENAVLTVVQDRLLLLNDRAALVVLPADATRWEPIATYEVAETPTFAHPALTPQGILIKDLEHLAMWSFEPAA